MTKPIDTSKLKDNSRKNYRTAEDWKAGKKFGRPKQHFVYDNGTHWAGPNCGHWENTK